MKKEIKSEPQLIKKHSLFLFSKVNNMPLTEETQTLITDEKAEHALTVEMKSPFADELRDYLTDELTQ